MPRRRSPFRFGTSTRTFAVRGGGVGAWVDVGHPPAKCASRGAAGTVTVASGAHADAPEVLLVEIPDDPHQC